MVYCLGFSASLSLSLSSGGEARYVYDGIEGATTLRLFLLPKYWGDKINSNERAIIVENCRK